MCTFSCISNNATLLESPKKSWFVSKHCGRTLFDFYRRVIGPGQDYKKEVRRRSQTQLFRTVGVVHIGDTVGNTYSLLVVEPLSTYI